jgi:predicted Zn finger-like uncharacterized protein
MALATRCPHCRTTFRVAHDQLKLRAGLVRCGACKEIFNGVEHLLRADDVPQFTATSNPAAVPAPATAAAPPDGLAENASSHTTAAPQPTSSVPEKLTLAQGEAGSPAPTAQPQPGPKLIASGLAATADFEAGSDPLLRMTLMDFTAFDTTDESNRLERQIPGSGTVLSKASVPGKLSLTEEDANAADDLGRAIKGLHRKPRRGINISSIQGGTGDRRPAESAEPNFVKRAKRQQHLDRTVVMLLGFGSAFLLICLVVQATYAFRNQIAISLPRISPALADMCATIGCRLDLPAQIEYVSIESSELQALAPNQNNFVLATLLRNRSRTHQAWPSIELTLNDFNEKVIARRVFSASDYLPSSIDLSRGFPANSEQSVRLFFELIQIKASGYGVYLFYP